MIYHVATNMNGKMMYLVGFEPGGKLTLGSQGQAMTFHQASSAERFRDELNARENGKKWYTVGFAEDAYDLQ